MNNAIYIGSFPAYEIIKDVNLEVCEKFKKLLSDKFVYKVGEKDFFILTKDGIPAVYTWDDVARFIDIKNNIPKLWEFNKERVEEYITNYMIMKHYDEYHGINSYIQKEITEKKTILARMVYVDSILRKMVENKKIIKVTIRVDSLREREIFFHPNTKITL